MGVFGLSKLRVSAFTISADGYGAGPGQALEHPLGKRAEKLHQWMLKTRTFRAMFGQEGGETGPDDDLARQSMEGMGAWIMGRNMFTPSRGAWCDDSWKGWWGDNPPFHVPVFVLTHHARSPLEMEGGTTFHFVTGGAQEAYDRAIEVAGGKDVRVGGGASTIRQYLRAGLIDEMHLVISPILLGSGEHLLEGIDLQALGLGVSEHIATPDAMHLVLTRSR